MSGGVSKRVYTNRRNVDIGGGVDKAGLPGSIGIPVMLRRFVAKRAPDGGKNSVVAEPIWRQIKKLVADDAENQAYFGTSVAIYGNYVVVGANRDDNDNNGVDNSTLNNGAAYLFKINADGTSATQIKKLVADDAENQANFGTSVAIYDNYVVVGAPYDDNDNNGVDNSTLNNGAAYIFSNS